MERSQSHIDAEIGNGNAGNLGRIGIVPDDRAEVEVQLAVRRKPALGAHVRVVIIPNAREHVVGRSVLAIKVERPVLLGPCFEAAKEGVSVVIFNVIGGCQERGRV